MKITHTCALSERSTSSQVNLSGRESGSSRTRSLSGSTAPGSVTFSSDKESRWEGGMGGGGGGGGGGE